MLDAIVTGAGGFVGRALTAEMARQGLSLLALERQHGDVAHSATWQNLPQAKAVIHLAGRSYVPDSWQKGPEFVEANLLGTERALAYCRQHGARMVYASAYVYGIPQGLPIAETHPAKPNNPYAMSKYLAEQLCEFASKYQGVSATVLRVFNVFGAGQRAEFLIPAILSQVVAGKEIRVLDLKPRRDYVFIDDVVSAFLQSLQSTSTYEKINIGSGVSYSVQDVIDVIQSVAGTSLPVVSQSSERAQEIPDVMADISLARRNLSWTPRWTFTDGVQKILNGAQS
ncbi:NAD(P)-dependent oxidoreductase [Polaromonas sp.]|uniref:NAD-dependent epimerase/dehydratase family protein n=1 Tax=Polaromonas sp. TaxID=1869339 RepID=UPI003263AE76